MNKSWVLPLRTLLAVGLVMMFGLTGCYRVTVTSVRDPDYAVPFERAYVLIVHGQLGPEFSEPLAVELKQQLAQQGIKAMVRISNPLELDETHAKNEASAFDAQVVLVVAKNGGLVSQYGGMAGIHYDASLYDVSSKKRIWRATIDNTGGTALITERMKEMAKTIVAKLAQDHLIGRARGPKVSEPTTLQQGSY